MYQFNWGEAIPTAAINLDTIHMNRIPDCLKKARGPCQAKAPSILMSVIIFEFAINIPEPLSFVMWSGL